MVPLVPRTPASTPHVILPGVCSMDCNYGPDRNKANKSKWVAKKTGQKDVDHSQTSSVSKVIIQRGHKVNCPAKITMKETFSAENEVKVILVVRTKTVNEIIKTLHC